MVFGMTLLAGTFEILLAQIIRRMRPFFPAEISGLCVLLIGTLSGILGIRLLFGIDYSGAMHGSEGRPSAGDFALAVFTLAVMIGLNVWSKGSLRMYCAIIGIIAGYLACAATGAVSATSLHTLTSAQVVALPHLTVRMPSFSFDLALPFAIGALACCLRGMGDITTCQKINDRDWVRPNLTSIRNGVVADGAGTVTSALLGGFGGNTYSSSVGMSSAVGVTARLVGFYVGALLVALSFFPIVAASLVSIPGPVMGDAVIFSACFVLISKARRSCTEPTARRAAHLHRRPGADAELEPRYFPELLWRAAGRDPAVRQLEPDHRPARGAGSQRDLPHRRTQPRKLRVHARRRSARSDPRFSRAAGRQMGRAARDGDGARDLRHRAGHRKHRRSFRARRPDPGRSVVRRVQSRRQAELPRRGNSSSKTAARPTTRSAIRRTASGGSPAS